MKHVLYIDIFKHIHDRFPRVLYSSALDCVNIYFLYYGRWNIHVLNMYRDDIDVYDVGNDNDDYDDDDDDNIVMITLLIYGLFSENLATLNSEYTSPCSYM